jgi:hypothetical protein
MQERNTLIVHTFTQDGAFVAGDTVSRLTCYAYPSSTHALRARKAPYMIAERMVSGERASPTRADYDARNWARLNAAPILADILSDRR